MEIAFYFYTILVMLVCIAAGTISLSAYFVCRKRSHLYMVAFFLFYFLDLALIFQNEYLGQNTEFPLEVFYTIDQPALRIFFALGIIQSLWLVALDFLGEKRLWLRIVPAVGFVVLSATVIIALPEGQYKQWLFYSMRQIFLLWCLAYALLRYRTTKSEIEKTRMRRQEPLFLITLVLTMCIILEDTFMMLVWDPDPASATMLPLYISERNFSENFLMLAFAFFSLREAAATLRLRFKEPPVSENPVVRQQIDDLLPAYSERHGMTAREREILALVLQGKDNQNIASELQLALGTVKAHVHNILKKTDHASRQELTRDFWKE
ncbi:helix-turn-helix domain-containing protein [Eggerthella timonensis]|uniref:helix-turn-helix domain-containing protein n=1 Tax=Eggerthella timonensis TaxID=1871008 RepID=UPI000C761F67|nr:helix-turn-helix transcriptional regulator [Eggerthella timonensis]